MDNNQTIVMFCNRCLAGTMKVTKKSRKKTSDSVIHTLKCDRCGHMLTREVPRSDTEQPAK